MFGDAISSSHVIFPYQLHNPIVEQGDDSIFVGDTILL